VPTTNINYVRHTILCAVDPNQPASTTVNHFSGTEGWTTIQYKDFNVDYEPHDYLNVDRTPGTYQARNYDNTVRTPAPYQRHDVNNNPVLL